jgi:hypothetical protein
LSVNVGVGSPNSFMQLVKESTMVGPVTRECTVVDNKKRE